MDRSAFACEHSLVVTLIYLSDNNNFQKKAKKDLKTHFLLHGHQSNSNTSELFSDRASIHQGAYMKTLQEQHQAMDC